MEINNPALDILSALTNSCTYDHLLDDEIDLDSFYDAASYCNEEIPNDVTSKNLARLQNQKDIFYQNNACALYSDGTLKCSFDDLKISEHVRKQLTGQSSSARNVLSEEEFVIPITVIDEIFDDSHPLWIGIKAGIFTFGEETNVVLENGHFSSFTGVVTKQDLLDKFHFVDEVKKYKLSRSLRLLVNRNYVPNI